MLRFRLPRVAGVALLGMGLAGACGGRQDGGTADVSAGQAGQESGPGAAGRSTVAGGQSSTGGESPAGGESSNGVAGDGERSAGGESFDGGAGGGGASGGDVGSNAGGEGGAPVVSPIPPGTGTVGSRCAATLDCEQGLQCLTATTPALNGAAPPHGLCTKDCTTDAQCDRLSPGSICYPFDVDDFQGYCVEGCTLGQTGVFRKCHARTDFSCMPALMGDTGFTCASGCIEGEVCENGTCQIVTPACLPTCRGDLDCARGLYCNTGWLEGTCTKIKPTGKKFGEPCTMPGSLEPDECLGFCLADVEGSDDGHCREACGMTNGCAWNLATKRFDGACYYASRLTSTWAVADLGYCSPACDCDAECSDDQNCFALTDIGALDRATYSGAGLCFRDEPLADPLVEQCQ